MQSMPAKMTEEEKSNKTVCRRPNLQNKERLVRADLSVRLNVYLAIYILVWKGGAREDYCPQRIKWELEHKKL
jgi:hypothetical protein